MKRLFREPLVHFLLIGAALFLVYRWSGGPSAPEANRLTVTSARIQQLDAGFRRVWQRAPTEPELRGLVDDFIREEVFYREALAMGLDRDDTIIRRRLRQKIEFLTDDALALEEPNEEELRAFFDEHVDRFRIEPTISFRHVYFNRDDRGDEAEVDARRLLSRLEDGSESGDLAAQGDPFLLPMEFELYTPSDVGRSFGREFAEQLHAVTPGSWSGPLVSAFGLHLVFVDERIEGRIPELNDVRQAVVREWRNTQRRTSKEEFCARLLEGYEVVVEWPTEAEGSGAAADPKDAEAESADPGGASGAANGNGR